MYIKKGLIALLLAAAALAGALSGCARSAGENTQTAGGNDTEASAQSEERELKTEKIELKFNEKTLSATGLDKGRGIKDGGEALYDRWVSTGYIDISGYCALEYRLGAHRFIYSLSFYDEDRNFIGGRSTDSILGYTVTLSHTPIPEGAKYARFANFEGTAEYPNTDGEPYVNAFTDEGDYEYYRNSVLKYPDLKIVCIGDSLTEGDYGKAPGVANRHYLNYPYYLAQELGCETVNDGRCGYTASGYYSLFAGGEVRVSDADIVLIMLGTNGGLTYRGDTELKAYKKLVAAVKKKAPADCLIVLIAPPHATEDRKRSNFGYNPAVENAAKEVQKFAEEAGYPLIDAYADSPILPENEDIYQPVDGLHLSGEGYQALARFFAQKIEDLIG